MRNTLNLSLAIMAASTFSTTAFGQETDTKPEMHIAPPAPPSSNDQIFEGIDFSLEVDSKKSATQVKIGGFTSQQIEDPKGNAGKTDRAWSLGVKIPFGGGDDLFDDGVFSELADGLALTGSFSIFKFNSAANALNNKDGEFRSKIMPEARSACVEKESDTSKCEVLFPDPQFARKYIDPTRVNRSLFSNMVRFGIDGELGAKRFKYVDLQTASKQADWKPNLKVGLFGALYPSDAQSAFIGRVEYENRFDPPNNGKGKVNCQSTVSDPDEDCQFGVPGGPSNVEAVNLSIEYRRTLEFGSKENSLGFSPKFGIDANSGEWETELPIYLILKKGSPILPGLKLSYESKKDEFDLGIFLRTTFSF